MARSRRAAPRRRGPVLLAVLVVLVVVALAAVTLVGGGDDAPAPDAAGGHADAPSSSPSPSASTSTAPLPPPPPRPRVQQCRRLDYDVAVATSDDTRAVPCTRPHTALTIAVSPLPRRPDGTVLDPAGPLSQTRVAATCRARAAEFLGGTIPDRQLSMLHPVWFVPTLDQRDRGADWFRCDLIAVAADGRLAPLVGPLRGVLDGAGADRYAMCATDAPGAADFRRVICSSPHSWRAITTVPLLDAAGPRGAYPGVATVRDRGQEPCRTAGADAASDPLRYRWGYEWPTLAQWTSGQTYGICWVPA